MNKTDLLLRAGSSAQGQGYDSQAEYDGSGNLLYVGYCSAGSANADNVWVLIKYFYDGSNRYIGERMVVNRNWTSRASFFGTTF